MVKIPKRRSCKVCKKTFKPMTLYEWWCCDKHKDELIPKLAAESRQRRLQKAEQRKKDEAQQERRNLKVRKAELQPLSHYHSKAQSAFNEYIRHRDADSPCVSCGRFHEGQWHAGHYRTVKASPETRYAEDNCHKQCMPCNHHLSGNLQGYKPSLIAKIGQEAFEALMGPHPLKKWTREELQELARHYRQKTKQLREAS